MIDALEELLRKTRPYELEHGSADNGRSTRPASAIDGQAYAERGVRGAINGFKQAVSHDGDRVATTARTRARTVLIVGEYLLNFHPGANHEIERYLEPTASRSSRRA